MKKKMISILALILATPHLMASSGDLEKVMAQEFRPSVEQVQALQSDIRKTYTTPVRVNHANWPHFTKAAEVKAPAFIAQLEKAYPGATFGFLGRDTQALADITESFFQSIGQKDRTRQVGLSRTSFDGLSDQDIVDFLKYYGFDLSRIEDQHPFILVDTISRGDSDGQVLVSGRQGRQILAAVYRTYQKQGGSLKKLLKKFNMIGLQVSTFVAHADNEARYGSLDEQSDIYKYNKELLSNVSDKNIGRDMKLVLLPDTNYKFNELGYDHFTYAWHDRYGVPQRQNDVLVPVAGQAMPAEYRSSILWFQDVLITMTGSEKFKQEVFSEATKLGYKFPVKRPEVSKKGSGIRCDAVYTGVVGL